MAPLAGFPIALAVLITMAAAIFGIGRLFAFIVARRSARERFIAWWVIGNCVGGYLLMGIVAFLLGDRSYYAFSGMFGVLLGILTGNIAGRIAWYYWRQLDEAE